MHVASFRPHLAHPTFAPTTRRSTRPNRVHAAAFATVLLAASFVVSGGPAGPEWASANGGLTGPETGGTSITVYGISFTKVAIAEDHAVGLASDGSVWSWGYDTFGQMGNGPAGNNPAPGRVLGEGGTGYLTGATDVAVGDSFSLAVIGSGGAATVVAWGYGLDGQLGTGTSSSSDVPVTVVGVGGTGTLTGVSQIATGNRSRTVLALVGSGSTSQVVGWGYNGNGYLGDGTPVSRPAPVAIVGVGGTGTLTGVSQISSSGASSHAIVGSGPTSRVVGWGLNYNGQLGDGTTVDQLVPTYVLGPGGSGYLEGASALAAAPYSSYALIDGKVAAWGLNSNGELGDGSIVNRSHPVWVTGVEGSGFLENVSSIAAGDGFAAAVVGSGANSTVVSWGSNSDNELGDASDATAVPYRSNPGYVSGPAAVGRLTGVTRLACGAGQAIALVGSGPSAKFYGWGRDRYGSLGTGARVNRIVPTLGPNFAPLSLSFGGAALGSADQSQNSISMVTPPGQGQVVMTGTSSVRAGVFEADPPVMVTWPAGTFTYIPAGGGNGGGSGGNTDGSTGGGSSNDGAYSGTSAAGGNPLAVTGVDPTAKVWGAAILIGLGGAALGAMRMARIRRSTPFR